MKITMAMAAAILALGSPDASARLRTNGDVVRVEVYYDSDPVVVEDGMIFWMARNWASYLLADAGVELVWHGGKPAEVGNGLHTIALMFVPTAPEKFRQGVFSKALAAARPYGAGTTISVFDDRLTAYMYPYKRGERSKIMGHVLAHEIVHVLEGVSRHSASGLMKAHWTTQDAQQITGTGLRMAEEDRELVRMRLMRPAGMPAVTENSNEDGVR